jgi:hypothetical protein
MLGQLLCVIGVDVAPQDQAIVSEHKLEIAHAPKEPAADVFLDAG